MEMVRSIHLADPSFSYSHDCHGVTEHPRSGQSQCTGMSLQFGQGSAGASVDRAEIPSVEVVPDSGDYIQEAAQQSHPLERLWSPSGLH